MGRLIDYCNRTYVEFNKLRFLVFDEADRMLEQGFLPEIQKMMSHPTMVRNTERQTVSDALYIRADFLNLILLHLRRLNIMDKSIFRLCSQPPSLMIFVIWLANI